ncbi:hypothetical protein [Amedibacillus sp. YH-ame10]
MKLLSRKVIIVLMFGFMFIIPAAVKAENYFYSGHYSLVEYKDTLVGNARYTYSTRYSAQSATVCAFVRHNDVYKVNSSCNYQNASTALANMVKGSHTHDRWNQ